MAAPVVNLDQIVPAVPTPLALTWADVVVLLKAGLNPRFCSSAVIAQQFIANPPAGDALAFMGGFSHIVALVRGAGTQQQKQLQAKFDCGKKNVDNYIEMWVDKYVYNPTAANWATLNTALNAVPAGSYAPLALTAAERDAIATRVQTELIAFFDQLSNGNQVWNVYLHAFDMVSMDQDAYGQFGKSGTKQLAPADVVQVVVQSSGKGAQPLGGGVNTNIPQRLVWAFLQQARARANVLTNAPHNFIP